MTHAAVALRHESALARGLLPKLLARSYDPDAPKGVRGRNSDNTKIKKLLGWEPNIPLRDGLEKTYAWIGQQYADRKAGKKTVS